MLRIPIRHLLMPTLLALALAGAACGDGESDDETAIREALSPSAGDAQRFCDENLTAALRTKLFGSAAKCVAVTRDQARLVSRPRDIRVDGDRATATAPLGDDGDGEDDAPDRPNRLTLIRDGGSWRISVFDARPTIAAFFSEADPKEYADQEGIVAELLSAPGMFDCIGARVAKQPVAAAEAQMAMIIAGDSEKAGEVATRSALVPCIAENPAAAGAMRRAFEAGLDLSGDPRADCVKREIRRTVPIGELVAAGQRQNETGNPGPAVARKLQEAKAACS